MVTYETKKLIYFVVVNFNLLSSTFLAIWVWLINLSYHSVLYLSFYSSSEDMFYWFGEERKGDRETVISCLPNAPQPGIEPTTQVCALMESNPHIFFVWNLLQATEPAGHDWHLHCWSVNWGQTILLCMVVVIDE